MLIRPETPEDHAAIHALTQAAFTPMAFSDGTEAGCIDQLRKDGDLALSLVAAAGDDLIGHVAFSRVMADGVFDGWYGLGPISVAVDHQKQGIGTALATKGCEALRAQGAKGVALIGNPKVYGPMGFVSNGALTYRDLPTTLVQQLPFGEAQMRGVLSFAPALEV